MPLRSLRWGRIVLGAIISEFMVIAVLSAVIFGYRFFIAPGATQADFEAFADRASYLIAPAWGGVATFLTALWVVRGLRSGFVANGVALGIVAVVLTFG